MLIDSVDFKFGLEFVTRAYSKEYSRPILQNVLFRFEPERLTLVAVDGYRLHLFKMPQTSQFEGYKLFAGKDMQKLASGILKSGGSVELEFDNIHNTAIFKQHYKGKDKVWNFDQAIESGNCFPDYEAIIPSPEHNDHYRVKFSDESLEIVTRAFEYCTMIIQDKKTTVGQNTKNRITLTCEFDLLQSNAKDHKFGINPAYLYAASVGEQSSIFCLPKHAGSPVWVDYPNCGINNSQLAVIMPCSIKE